LLCGELKATGLKVLFVNSQLPTVSGLTSKIGSVERAGDVGQLISQKSRDTEMKRNHREIYLDALQAGPSSSKSEFTLP
jgi:hypothetical protein